MPHNSTQFQYSPEIALGPTVKGSISQDWDTCQLQVEILVTCVSDHWLHFGGFHDLLLGFYYNNLLEQLTEARVTLTYVYCLLANKKYNKGYR